MQSYILFPLSAIPKNDGFGKIPRYGDRRKVLGWLSLKKNSIFAANINDQYPKYILTLDEDPTADYNGIKRINAIRWLMGETELNQKKVWK